MIRTPLLIIAFSLSLQIWAAPIEVIKLYDQQSHIPGVLIPLRIKGDLLNAGGSIFEIQVESGGIDCRVMKDPYIADTYLLKCADEASVNLRVRVSHAGRITDLVYGPLPIIMPAAGLEVIQPDDPNAPDVFAGKQLFNSYCVNCHNPASVKRDRNAAQIRKAMTAPNNPYGMNFLNSVLSDTDLKKIEAYLKSL